MAGPQPPQNVVSTAARDEVRQYLSQSTLSLPDSLSARSPDRIDAIEQADFQSIYSDYRKSQDSFVNTAKKCLAKLKQPPMTAEGIVNWDGVLSSMESACTAMDKASSRDKDLHGVSGKLKKTFRFFCSHAATGKLLANLVPGDSFGSVLGGGLSVIFTCLEQTSQHRTNVYKALERLPRILNNNAEYTKLVDGHREVHVRAAKLYTEVCITLEHILRWFILNPFAAGAKHLLNPSAANTNLSDRLAEVDLAAKDLKIRATQIMWAETKDGQAGLSKAQEWLAHQGIRTGHQLDSIGADIKLLVDRHAFYDTIETVVRDNLGAFLQGEMRRILLEEGRPKAPKLTSLTKEDVLRELLYNPALIPEDVKALLRLGLPMSMTSVDPDRVHAIQRHPRMRSWLTIDEPSLLLLNGGAEDQDLCTSFVCAKLAYSLQQQGARLDNGTTVVALGYFCSQHQNSYRDPAGSPTELAMSLLLQLVDQVEFEAEDLQQCLDRTNPDSVPSICASLRRLLARVPKEVVVYVFVDGIVHFTRPPRRREGIRRVVESLVEIYREHTEIEDEEDTPLALKMMFTSAVKSRFLEDFFTDDERVDIPLDPPPTNGTL